MSTRSGGEVASSPVPEPDGIKRRGKEPIAVGEKLDRLYDITVIGQAGDERRTRDVPEVHLAE